MAKKKAGKPVVAWTGRQVPREGDWQVILTVGLHQEPSLLMTEEEARKRFDMELPTVKGIEPYRELLEYKNDRWNLRDDHGSKPTA